MPLLVYIRSLPRRLGRSVRTTKRQEGRRVQPVVPRSALSRPSGRQPLHPSDGRPYARRTASTLRRLLRTVLGTTTIPFHGEPAVGLQVMGVLETRNLNFRSYPDALRQRRDVAQSRERHFVHPLSPAGVFGLTTIQHKIAVYAFYFYRLVAAYGTYHIHVQHRYRRTEQKRNVALLAHCWPKRIFP